MFLFKHPCTLCDQNFYSFGNERWCKKGELVWGCRPNLVEMRCCGKWEGLWGYGSSQVGVKMHRRLFKFLNSRTKQWVVKNYSKITLSLILFRAGQLVWYKFALGCSVKAMFIIVSKSKPTGNFNGCASTWILSRPIHLTQIRLECLKKR